MTSDVKTKAELADRYSTLANPHFHRGVISAGAKPVLAVDEASTKTHF
jgi:hypothetical protein